MADTYSSIMFNVMNTYDSIISNNLNNVMKKLAIINIVMMSPTFVTSYFGMNVKLPFDHLAGYIPIVYITICCVISVVLTILALNVNKESVRNLRARRKQQRKQRKNASKSRKMR